MPISVSNCTRAVFRRFAAALGAKQEKGSTADDIFSQKMSEQGELCYDVVAVTEPYAASR